MDPQTFLDNFATIAGAPGGVQRLRDLVLDLALRGDLSDQEATDGLVEDLLAETSRQLKDLEARRAVQKLAPTRPVGSAPHEIPASWSWEPLGRIVAILDFRRQPVKQEDRLARIEGRSPETLYPYFGATQQAGVIDDYLFDEELVLLGEDGAPFLTPGKHVAYLATGKYWVNNHAHVMRGLATTNRYLVLALNRVAFYDFVTGTTRLKLTQGKMVHIPIPIPPLAEQERIVVKVDELMALCDELEARQDRRHRTTTHFRASALHALAEAETLDGLHRAWERVSANYPVITGNGCDVEDLRLTVLQLAIGGQLVCHLESDGSASADVEEAQARKKALTLGLRKQPLLPGSDVDERSLPRGWTWTSIDDLFLVTGGIQKSPKRRPRENHHPYLRVANVQRGRLDLREIERFELLDEELNRLRLEPGDLLIVEGNGSESEIGRCARWNGEIEGCVHQNHLIRCRPMVEDIEHYVLLFLNSPAGMEAMKDLAVTTSGLYNLSVGKIRSIRIPLPPMAEQVRIRKRMEQLTGLCDALAAQLARRSREQEKLAASAVKNLAS